MLWIGRVSDLARRKDSQIRNDMGGRVSDAMDHAQFEPAARSQRGGSQFVEDQVACCVELEDLDEGAEFAIVVANTDADSSGIRECCFDIQPSDHL